jgi:galactokinase
MNGSSDGQPQDLSAPERITGLFRRRFSSDPVVAHAPGRVNLIGEHVDYLDGVVLPMGIDRRAAVAIAPASDGCTTISAFDMSLEHRSPGPPATLPVQAAESRFANHVLGVIAASGGSDEPLSILVTSDIPPGAGVSSSAAIEVATGAALAKCLGKPLPNPMQLAFAARRAEHEFVGTPCGIMDMLVSAAAEEGSALRIDCRDLEYESIPLPSEERLAFMLVDSGVAHRLADGGYAERRVACERIVSILGRSLRDCRIDDLEDPRIGDTPRRRARHVIAEIARVDAVIDALRRDDLDTVGSIMLDGHRSLRDLFEVSVDELDQIVESAASMVGDGCFGARMTGGGFGGSVIVLHRPSATNRVRDRIEADFMKRFGRRPDSMIVRPAVGARPCRPAP